jgi:hypothetical protein
MPRWRALLFKCGLVALAIAGLMTAFALVHGAGLDSDTQEGLDLVKAARWILCPALISVILCAFGKGLRRAGSLAIAVALFILCYLVAFHFE